MVPREEEEKNHLLKPGLGSMLIDACLRFCGEKEAVDAVILWPTPRSRRLYERHGFAVREDILERRLGPPPSP